MLEVDKQVVCVKKESWKYQDPFTAELYPEGAFGPKYNEIVTVCSVIQREDRTLLSFYEYQNHIYPAKWFQPIIDDSTLQEEIAEIWESIPVLKIFN
jgi:hypothetical protein